MKKLSGSTLIETLVAMVMLLAIVGISLMILSNLALSNNPILKLKALNEAKEIILLENHGIFSNDTSYSKDGLRIEFKKELYKDTRSLYLIHVEMIDTRDRLILEKECLSEH